MFARTKRLMLRPGWPEDAPALAAAIGHESVVTKISHAPWPYSEEDARDFLGRPRGAHDATLLVTTLEGGTARVVGCMGIHPEGDAHAFGYWLTPEAWGRGYATEAGLQMMEIARSALGLTRLRAGHYVDNPASARVLAKFGFVPTGRVDPQFCRARGEDVACVRVERVFASDVAVPIAA